MPMLSVKATVPDLPSPRYTVSASWNIYRNQRNRTPLLPSAPLMTASLFIRRTVFISLGMIYITTIYLYIITQTTQTSLDTIPPISQVRAHASEIDVPNLDPISLVEIELVWWAIPILSLAMCMLSALGEETRKGYKGIINWFSRRFVGRNILPIQYVPMFILTPQPITEHRCFS